MSEWIECSKRPPPDYVKVLFADPHDIYFGYTIGGAWLYVERDRDGDPIEVSGVTHWMPLPELPK